MKDASNEQLSVDKCHNTRNHAEYEGLLDVDELLAAELVKATQAVAKAL